MIITKMALPRRTFLRTVGATLALPMLDAMVPALSTAAEPVRRLGFVYLPMGAVMDQWTPATTGKDFPLSPILNTFAGVRDQLTVLTGLDNAQAAQMGAGNGGHSRCAAVYLTCTHPKHTEGADIQAGTSIDQIAAGELGKHTQLPSLELAIDTSNAMVGNCENGYSCAYINTISWRTPTSPNPMESNPRKVFERLFGDGETRDQQLVRMQNQRSILDWVRGDLRRLERELGVADRVRVAEYLDAVRAVEQRIQLAEQQGDEDLLPLPAAPYGIPLSYEEHVELMFDMLWLAYRSDVTRVFTFALGRELSNRTYPQIGVPEAHHGVSHHQNDPVKLAKLVKLQAHHAQLTASFLERLKTTEDGDGSLLDHSVTMFGSGMSNSNVHDYTNLPVALFGGGSGQLQGSRHLSYAGETPVASLYLSLLDKVGSPVEEFGDGHVTLSGL